MCFVPAWLLVHSGKHAWGKVLGWAMAACCLALMAVETYLRLEVQRFVSLLLLPTGLLWLALLALTVGLMADRRWKWSAAALCLWLAYSAAGNSLLGSWLMRSLEAEVPPVPVGDFPKLDAVFVLGGGTGLAPDGTPELSSSGDRLFKAAALYHAGVTPILVCSGSSLTDLDKDGKRRDIARDTADLWAAVGVPQSAIRRIPGGLVTSTEIASYEALIRSEGWGRVGLISSAWHLPRALRKAKQLNLNEGVEIVPIGCDYQGNPPTLWPPFFVVPQAGGFQLVNRAVWERGGMLVGR